MKKLFQKISIPFAWDKEKVESPTNVTRKLSDEGGSHTPQFNLGQDGTAHIVPHNNRRSTSPKHQLAQPGFPPSTSSQTLPETKYTAVLTTSQTAAPAALPAASASSKGGSWGPSLFPHSISSQLPPPPSATASSESGDSKQHESKVIAVARHAPPGLRDRKKWSIHDFELRKQMYNGNISLVYHAVDRQTGITVALKLYKRSKLNEIERHQVAREIRLHTELSDESVIHLYASWKDRQHVYLVLEWAPGGDLYTYLKARGGYLSEELAVSLVIEPFIHGINSLHQQGMIHRDIKPENILLNNSFQIKIADFGLSIDSRSEIANTRLGTIDYLAPEILDCPVKQHPEDHKNNPQIGYTNKVDCWSIGVLCFELLTGQPPFASPSAQQTLRLIRTKTVEIPSHLSPEAADFITGVLVRDPAQRPTCTQLLQHPWIQKYSRRDGINARRLNARTQRSTSDPVAHNKAASQGSQPQQHEPNHTALPPIVKNNAGSGSVPLPPNPAPAMHPDSAPSTPHTAEAASSNAAHLQDKARAKFFSASVKLPNEGGRTGMVSPPIRSPPSSFSGAPQQKLVHLHVHHEPSRLSKPISSDAPMGGEDAQSPTARSPHASVSPSIMKTRSIKFFSTGMSDTPSAL